MQIFQSLSDTFRRLTGIQGRNNRVLGTVKDWTETVDGFLKKYNLYENASSDVLLVNSGDVKFELTEIVYKGRLLITQAGKLQSKHISPMISAVIENGEDIRRYLINPALQKNRLEQAVQNFLLSMETLRNALDKIQYL